jgi:hypothetical protein
MKTKKQVVDYIKYRIKRYGLNKLLSIDDVNENLLCYFDTSISSLNVGDEIINDSGKKELEKVMSDKQFFISNTHNGISGKSISDANNSCLRIVCGTNLLHPNLARGMGSWNIGFLDAIRLKKVLLMGVGWASYSKKVNWINRVFYRMLLSNEGIHSVRDNYTKGKLEEIGFENVVNTGCPTMWGLTPDFCHKIKRTKARDVIFTLTDYEKTPQEDKYLIDTLKAQYENVYYWPQGSGDLIYLNELDIKGVINLPPRLSAYDDFLRKNDVDYIGTRLHGGIRALQHLKRTLIVSIDNRAREKAKDFNIPVVERDKLRHELQNKILSEADFKISINQNEIQQWLAQFSSE